MDPDPAVFVIDLQDANKKTTFFQSFSACFFLKVHLHHFSKIKSHKEIKNSTNQVFFNFCSMIEGSGSRRLKNKRIWIRNTGSNSQANILNKLLLQKIRLGFRMLIQIGSVLDLVIESGSGFCMSKGFPKKEK
jgi:hypothetical protein